MSLRRKSPLNFRRARIGIIFSLSSSEALTSAFVVSHHQENGRGPTPTRCASVSQHLARMIPPLPTDEVQRLQAVRTYEARMKWQRPHHRHLVEIVAGAFEVPMAFVTMIDINQQRFNACYGVHLPPIDRRLSLCAHAMLERGVTVVSNARQDPRFMRNPLVLGEPNIRFYAGAPLRTRAGHVIGTLVIADAQPRELGRGHRALLEEFAQMIMDELQREESRPAPSLTVEAL